MLKRFSRALFTSAVLISAAAANSTALAKPPDLPVDVKETCEREETGPVNAPPKDERPKFLCRHVWTFSEEIELLAHVVADKVQSAGDALSEYVPGCSSTLHQIGKWIDAQVTCITGLTPEQLAAGETWVQYGAVCIPNPPENALDVESRVTKLLNQYQDLMRAGRFDDAKAFALKAKCLQPDNAAAQEAFYLAVIKAKLQRSTDIQNDAIKQWLAADGAYCPGVVKPIDPAAEECEPPVDDEPTADSIRESWRLYRQGEHCEKRGEIQKAYDLYQKSFETCPDCKGGKRAGQRMSEIEEIVPE
jgi:tetratricopeptide (TPR) repeat protein